MISSALKTHRLHLLLSVLLAAFVLWLTYSIKVRENYNLCGTYFADCVGYSAGFGFPLPNFLVAIGGAGGVSHITLYPAILANFTIYFCVFFLILYFALPTHRA
jgi:hypothetical protein